MKSRILIVQRRGHRTEIKSDTPQVKILVPAVQNMDGFDPYFAFQIKIPEEFLMGLTTEDFCIKIFVEATPLDGASLLLDTDIESASNESKEA